MEILNKRERKLFKLIKKEMKQNNIYTVEENELHIYSSLLNKLKKSNLVYIIYPDNCAIIHGYDRLQQFETEEHKKRKEERQITSRDYKVVIFSAIVTGIITYIFTFLSLG